jgi:plastocyanin
MRRLTLLIAIAATTAAFVPAGQGAGGTLTGTVGPGFTIALTQNGAPVKQLDPGDYTIQISDKSAEHNFHLTGPGVDETTDVEQVGDETWNVTLKDGKYSFVCDVHVSTMKGSFQVGAAPPTTTTPKLYGAVGPGRTIALGTAAGKRTAKVAAGKYSIIVRDRSKTESFHLSGPGVNRKTGKAFTGSATWTVTLKAASTYRYWSDAHPALKGTLKTS